MCRCVLATKIPNRGAPFRNAYWGLANDPTSLSHILNYGIFLRSSTVTRMKKKLVRLEPLHCLNLNAPPLKIVALHGAFDF